MASHVISEADVANTYENGTGWETVTQYRKAAELRKTNPNLSRAEIARRVGRSQATVRGWLVEENTPDPVRGHNTAAAHGWLSADVDSELFRAFNSLIGWVYAGGAISQETFVPTFSADEPLDVVTLEHLLSVVDLPYQTRERGESQAVDVTPGAGAPVLGRLLITLGAPVGRKAANQSLTLPVYLDEAPRHLRRDFARVYLFTRGILLSQAGTYRIGEDRTSGYLRELHSFFSSVLDADVFFKDNNRIIIPPEGTSELCEEAPRRPALAASIAHGAVTPPVDRAVLSTYRRGEIPSGPRYLKAYRATTETQTDRAELAEEYDLSEVTIYNWRNGTTPRLVTAMNAIEERGWLLPDKPEPARTLTALAAWLVASGSLQQTFNPVFRLRTEAQRSWLQTLVDQLELSLSTRFETDPDRTIECHISTDASRLGRALHAMGVPLSRQDSGDLTPPFVWYDTELARVYVSTWILHHGELEGETLHIGTAYGAREWVTKALIELARERLGWTIQDRSGREWSVLYPEIRRGLIETLGPEIVDIFEEDNKASVEY